MKYHQLNKWQIECAASYKNGFHRSILEKRNRSKIGFEADLKSRRDSLFTFLMQELGKYDEKDPGRAFDRLAEASDTVQKIREKMQLIAKPS
jgi:hypothetical protein